MICRACYNMSICLLIDNGQQRFQPSVGVAQCTMGDSAICTDGDAELLAAAIIDGLSAEDIDAAKASSRVGVRMCDKWYLPLEWCKPLNSGCACG